MYLRLTKQLKYRLLLGLLIIALTCVSGHGASFYESETARFRVVPLISGLVHPWSLAFLPDGDLLITERPGRLRVVRFGHLLEAPIAGVPVVAAVGQGGLLDLVLHPDFATNRLLCLSYSRHESAGSGTAIICGELVGDRLINSRVIFAAEPKSRGGKHFGSRLVFDVNGNLYATLGDRGIRAQAQDLSRHPGSVIRIDLSGAALADNPFVHQDDAQPEIFTYGNRNPQGLAWHPKTGVLWMHEHGPKGGDELNRVIAGTNYGWPVISYGKEYWSQNAVGEGTHKIGMAQPVHHWVPSIAPSGMAFYSGNRFPQWQGNLFIGSLKFGELVRLEIDASRVVHEERLLNGDFGRIRDVRLGPDGLLYLLTDSRNGHLLRLEPIE
ncbi:MAG TPA: PQQ-dependent sugar dehydrogenase [Arenicellales bacterium]|jgi:glucose/arabinose dehydrogenase|nr:PQQ-dependent sugar dehydrogenase [Arenicellales bacterium]|tara:strand:- start:105 stop:1250 length:1146 start_codon:yes stop_codon:yes gene_type:complete